MWKDLLKLSTNNVDTVSSLLGSKHQQTIENLVGEEGWGGARDH